MRADLALGDRWKAQAVYEPLAPGSFYRGSEGGHFLRLEVSWLFRTRL